MSRLIFNPRRGPIFGINNDNDDDTTLTDDNMNEEDDTEEGGLDPSLIAPRGVLRRVRRSTLANPPDVKVQRTALTVSKKREEFRYDEPHEPGIRESVANSVRKKGQCSKKKVKHTLFLRLPILDWLFHYKVKKDLVNDIISGVTVAIMHIPQGMGYALLANLDPIIGIYMAFFPVLVYATFASSKHCSMGTFAVVCIMVGKVVNEMTLANDVTSTEVGAILSFACGIWMLIFGGLQLGTLCVFLSDMLVSGFTTGAAIHVVTSQVPKLFGMNFTSPVGVFKIPKTWYLICQNLLTSNSATMVISLLCLFVLILNNEVFKPKLKKVTRLPFPIELILVVVGTLASRYGELNANFNVEIIGDIPTGLPPPILPPFDLLGQVVVSSLTITIVAFSVSFSMAKIFAKRFDYEVDATQELYALGVSNLVGSVFLCAPIAASLSRTMVQTTVGGATQLTSYISCSLLILVLLFIGPFFSTLPNSVLAAIIAVSLKGMFLQVGDFFRTWRVSRVDALLWLFTFLGVIIIDIDYGLLLGILASLLILLARNQAPFVALLGRVPSTDIYLDRTRYAAATDTPGVKICQVLGTLHFANQDSFRQRVVKTTGLDPKAIQKWKRKQEKLLKRQMLSQKQGQIVHKVNGEAGDTKRVSSGSLCEGEGKGSLKDQILVDSVGGLKANIDLSSKESGLVISQEVVNLIMDFSGLSQMDVSGARNLAILHKDYDNAGVVMVFAALSEPCLEIMKKCGASKDLPEQVFFHSVPDAVAFLTTTSAPLENGLPEMTAHL